MYLVDVVLGQGGHVLRGGGMGGDKQPGLHGLDRLQSGQVGGHVVDEGDLILVQRLAAGQAVGQVDHVLRRAEAHHVEEVTGQGQQLKALRQHVRRQLMGVAGLGHEELVAQLPRREAAVEKGRLQQRVAGDVALDSGGVDGAAGLLLQILVAAHVVGVGVGVVDGGETPAVFVQVLAHLAARVLVAAAVDEADIRLVQADKADLGGAFDVIAALAGLDELVHGRGLLFVLCIYPHRVVSMGTTCFFRDMTPGRNTVWSLGSTAKALRMVSSLPT